MPGTKGGPAYRLSWATDIHLDQCAPEAFATFIEALRAENPDGICLTGDLSEAPRLQADLERVAEAVGVPVYFVLGNHDYYHGSIAEVREAMTRLTATHPLLRWLPATSEAAGIALGPNTRLIGHGAWGDGGNGNIRESWIRLQDFRKIAELNVANGTANGEADALSPEERKARPITEALIEVLQQLGQEAADFLKPRLLHALQAAPQVFLLMHPPPFREACLYGTEMADDHWAPHFTCKAVGDMLIDVMAQHPEHQLTVLAGHTHNVHDAFVHPNIRVCVGAAEYGHPAVAQRFML